MPDLDDAWTQAGRFQGDDKSRVIDGAEIRSYPMLAIEEAIAFGHKHLLPFSLTIEDLSRGVSKLRNRVIGRVFHALGLIEQGAAAFSG